MLFSIAIDGEGQREDHGGVLKKITSFYPPDRTSCKRRLTCSSIFDQPDCLKSRGQTQRHKRCFVSEETGGREGERENKVRTASEGRSGGEAGRRATNTYVDRGMYV